MTNPQQQLPWGAQQPQHPPVTPDMPALTVTQVAPMPAAVPAAVPAAAPTFPQQAAPPAAAPPAAAPLPAAPQQAAPAQQAAPTQETPPATPPATEPPPAEELPSIQSRLREFAKKPGCDKYSGDAKKIALLGQYLWLRQLTPALTFETFLELYAPMCDFDKENLKHPDDAINALLPRSKAKAEAANTQQWAAKDVVDYVALYVDMIRAAEQQSVPVPLSLNDFLVNPNLIEQFRAGAFAEPNPPKRGRPAGKSRKRGVEQVPPSAAGQRCVYTDAENRQHRGTSLDIRTDEASGLTFGDFQSDAGEVFRGVGISSLVLSDDPPPNPVTDSEGEVLPEKTARLRISKAEAARVHTALSSPGPLGTVELGDVLYSYGQQYDDGLSAGVTIVNGQPRPYVDATLYDAEGNALVEVQPREQVEGRYVFPFGEYSYVLEVTTNA